MNTISQEETRRRACDVRVMIFDVDGVLTDGRLHYDAQGETLKVFHVLDGQGLKLLQAVDIRMAVISGRASAMVMRRLQDLPVAWIRQGEDNKAAALADVCRDLQVTPEQCGYMGDDLIDLPVLTRVRFAATVPSASDFVRRHVHWVAQRDGGMGAVRDVCDYLLWAQDKLAALQQAYVE